MENIPLTQYLTQNNYNAAEQIVMANGFNKPESAQQTLNALNLLLVRNGQPFLDVLADNHPDYDLIEERIREKDKLSKDNNKKHEDKSNANGGHETTKTDSERKAMFVNQMQVADENTSNLDGTKTTAISNDDKHIKMLVIGGSILLAGILIWKIA